MREIIFPISGISVYIKNKALVVAAEEPLTAVNSSVLNGGFCQPLFILNQQVEKGYAGSDPAFDLAAFAEGAGLRPEDTAGMMTAAQVEDAACVFEAENGLTVAAMATAGLSNAIAAGGKRPPAFNSPGTINIILLIDGNPTPAAMINGIITVTEGKTMALQDQEIKDVFSGEAASGTSTDAVVIAATGRGLPLDYAGTATLVGGMIGRTVRRAVTETVKIYLKKKAEKLK